MKSFYKGMAIGFFLIGFITFVFGSALNSAVWILCACYCRLASMDQE